MWINTLYIGRSALSTLIYWILQKKRLWRITLIRLLTRISQDSLGKAIFSFILSALVAIQLAWIPVCHLKSGKLYDIINAGRLAQQEFGRLRVLPASLLASLQVSQNCMLIYGHATVILRFLPHAVWTGTMELLALLNRLNADKYNSGNARIFRFKWKDMHEK